MGNLRTNVKINVDNKGAKRELREVERGLTKVSAKARKAKADASAAVAAGAGVGADTAAAFGAGTLASRGARFKAALARSPISFTSEGLVAGAIKINESGVRLESPFLKTFGTKVIPALAAGRIAAGILGLAVSARDFSNQGASGLASIGSTVGQGAVGVAQIVVETLQINKIMSTAAALFYGTDVESREAIIRERWQGAKDFYTPQAVLDKQQKLRDIQAQNLATFANVETLRQTLGFFASHVESGADFATQSESFKKEFEAIKNLNVAKEKRIIEAKRLAGGSGGK